MCSISVARLPLNAVAASSSPSQVQVQLARRRLLAQAGDEAAPGAGASSTPSWLEPAAEAFALLHDRPWPEEWLVPLLLRGAGGRPATAWIGALHDYILTRVRHKLGQVEWDRTQRAAGGAEDEDEDDTEPTVSTRRRWDDDETVLDVHEGLLRALSPIDAPQTLMRAVDFLEGDLIGLALRLDEASAAPPRGSTSPWDRIYQLWTRREARDMLDEVLEEIRGGPPPPEGIERDYSLEDVEQQLVEKLREREESIHKVIGALAEFKPDLLRRLRSFELATEAERRAEPEEDHQGKERNGSRADARDPFSWSIMSQLLEFTRTESLRCIKKQRPWGAMKRSVAQQDELGRQVQATSGHGRVLHRWGHWERRLPIADDELADLREEAALRLCHGDGSVRRRHYRQNVVDFIDELTEWAVCQNFSWTFGRLGDHTSLDQNLECSVQIFSDYLDFFEDSAKAGDEPGPVAAACARFAEAVALEEAGPAGGEVASLALGVLEEAPESRRRHLRPWRMMERNAGTRPELVLPLTPRRWDTLAACFRSELHEWRKRQEDASRSEVTRVRGLKDTSWSAREPTEDPLLVAIDTSKEKCPDCRRPLRIETIQIARSDEAHNLIGKCYHCKLSVEKGKVYRA